MKHCNPWKQLTSLVLALVLVIGLVPAGMVANAAEAADNQNNDRMPTAEWVYTPSSAPAALTAVGTEKSADSSADLVKVHVKATDRATNKKVSVAGASVNLYVGAAYHGTFVSDENGIAEVSLAGLSYTQRKNATISASKVVSRGKAIDGTARDDLFQHFPRVAAGEVGNVGEYYRYSLELHSETIDSNGNWLGAEIPDGKESNKVDIVFIVDATGSMHDEINAVKNNIASFSENLIESGLDIRFCIIDYRDITIPGEDTKVYTIDGSHWMNDIDSVVKTLASISVSGGGDGPETVIDPLGYVADNSLMSWRSDAYRFAFVLTDANHKTDNGYGYKNLTEVADKLAEMEVVTSVICARSYNNYKYLYEKTGGIWADIYSRNFAKEMLNLSNSIIESVVREMTLELKEPRLLVNMSVCYLADDETSRSDAYRESVKNVLKAYSMRLAEVTDGHVMLDKVLLFNTNSRVNFYETTQRASMADIRIETRAQDEGKGMANVTIRSNAYMAGFYSDNTYTASSSKFTNLIDGSGIQGKQSFYRIQLSGTTEGWEVAIDNKDDEYEYSTTIMHEAGHYLLGLFDEYLDANGDTWNDGDGVLELGESQWMQPYFGEDHDTVFGGYGLMDNHHYGDIELSKTQVDYRYMTDGFSKADISLHTNQSFDNKGSCEDSLATLLTDPAFSTYYNKYKERISASGYKLGDYLGTYSKASVDRDVDYPYAVLDDADFLSLPSDRAAADAAAPVLHAIGTAEPVFTSDKLADVSFSGNGTKVTIQVSGDVAVGLMKAGDEAFAKVTLKNGAAELPVAKGEMAQVRITDTGSGRYNTYYIDRSPDTKTGYLYCSADNAVMAYVTTDKQASYTFVADNTGYRNGEYRSVNQATRITGDNGAGFKGGEIYSVADYLAEIDYTTLTWFKFANGSWTALATDCSAEENMNIGARADLNGEGVYVLMAKQAPVGGVLPAKNLAYTQSQDRDAVVTLSFEDPNPNSKYYNVYYSEKAFTDKNAADVTVRSFDASSTKLTINLLERGRKVYAAVEIVAQNGSRSGLSEIILIGGEADSDGDGIPDWYCDKYHLWGENIASGDADGDGLTNLEEYRGGSDPTDPNDPVHTTNIPVVSVSVSRANVKLFVGGTARVTAIVMPVDATNRNVTWTSADSGIASVRAEGGACVITAMAPGRTQVYAVTADGGFSAAVTVEVDGSLPFGDVDPEGWYREAVEYVYHNGLMKGVSENLFAPGEKVTRGMAVTVVHRLAGSPAAEGAGFPDVPEGAWYADAVRWAQANDIVTGYEDGTFRPDQNMTRQELVAVFYRYAKKMGRDVSAVRSITVFSDCAQVQSYAEDAMGWAVSNGLIQGFPDGSIRPLDDTNRAQMATIVKRFVELFRR